MAIVRNTERLTLREFTPDDLGPLAAIFADPRVMYFGPGVRSRSETADWIERMRAMYRVRGLGLWAVVLRRTDALAGVCGLIPQVIEGEDRLEVGYRLAVGHQGRGIASEAAQACKALGFRRFDRSDLISIIEPANAPSIRVAEKNGMTPEREVEIWHRPVRIYCVHRDGQKR